jgi:acyl carrier protein
MANVEDRLVGIFETTFPDLDPSAVRSATQESTANWDSVAAITLMNLIEEEFAIEMDFGDLGDLTSFEKIRDYISTKVESVSS